MPCAWTRNRELGSRKLRLVVEMEGRRMRRVNQATGDPSARTVSDLECAGGTCKRQFFKCRRHVVLDVTTRPTANAGDPGELTWRLIADQRKSRKWLMNPYQTFLFKGLTTRSVGMLRKTSAIHNGS